MNSGGPGGGSQGAVKAQSFIDKALHVWILLLRPGNDEEQAATVDWMADQLKRVCSAGSPSGSWDPHHPSNVCVGRAAPKDGGSCRPSRHGGATHTGTRRILHILTTVADRARRARAARQRATMQR